MEKKRKLVFLAITMLLFISCKKDEPSSVMDTKQLLDLSQYKLSAIILNDSIIEYKGENKKITIQGKYNRKLHHKIGWWSIYNKRNRKIYSKVQIFLEGGIEKNNQVVIYNQNKIDTAKSKFYTVNVEYKNNKLSKVKYNFYTPKSDYLTEYVDLYYDIYIAGNSVVTKKISIKPDNNSHHYHEIDLSEYKNGRSLFIGGLFIEYSFSDKNKEMGMNEIFIEDSLKVSHSPKNSNISSMNSK